jgi:hypothetical protein
MSPREAPASIGGGRGSRGSHLDPENEITRNRDFYRAHDVRPPFTYAALIRQVKIYYNVFQYFYLFKTLNIVYSCHDLMNPSLTTV